MINSATANEEVYIKMENCGVSHARERTHQSNLIVNSAWPLSANSDQIVQ